VETVDEVGGRRLLEIARHLLAQPPSE